MLFGYATPLADGWTLDSFFMYRDTRQLHRGHPDGAAVLDVRLQERSDRRPQVQDVHDRAQPQPAQQLGDDHELRVEQALRQLRPGLFRRPGRRGGLQHVVAAQRRPGIVHRRHEPPGRAQPGSPARVQGAGHVESEVGGEPERGRVGAVAERHAVGGARPARAAAAPRISTTWSRPARTAIPCGRTWTCC